MIMNKEATAKNKALLDMINRFGSVKTFSTGGFVEAAYEKSFNRRLDDKILTLGNLGFAATAGMGGIGDPGNANKMDQVLREIRLAIDRAPQSLRPKLQEAAAAKLQNLIDETQSSIDLAVDNASDPLSTVQNSPGLLTRLQDKLRFFQNAVGSLGGQDLGGAYLGGFAPPSPKGGDLAHASPNFSLPSIASASLSRFGVKPSFNLPDFSKLGALPDISGLLNNAMEPVSRFNSAVSGSAPSSPQIAPSPAPPAQQVEKVFTLNLDGIQLKGGMAQAGNMDALIRRLTHQMETS